MQCCQVHAFRECSMRRLGAHSREQDFAIAARPGDYSTTAQWQATERVRLRKACGFVQAQSVVEKVLATTLALKPALTLLGRHFASSRQMSSSASPLTLLDWLSPNCPVTQPVSRYLELLQNPHNSHWTIIRCKGWPRRTEQLHVICHAYLVAFIGPLSSKVF